MYPEIQNVRKRLLNGLSVVNRYARKFSADSKPPNQGQKSFNPVNLWSSRFRNIILSPGKIAFIHIPKTAGSYVSQYLRHFVIPEYQYLDSWHDDYGLKRDWNWQEFFEVLDVARPPCYATNHVWAWKEEIFRKFKNDGWFTFSFIRHTGDQLCSAYFYFYPDPNKRPYSLDDDIKRNLLSDIEMPSEWNIPPYWKEMDFIAEFSEEVYADFLRDYFGHVYKPFKKIRESENKGYDSYCKEGLISEETQELLMKSKQYQLYLKIKSGHF